MNLFNQTMEVILGITLSTFSIDKNIAINDDFRQNTADSIIVFPDHQDKIDTLHVVDLRDSTLTLNQERLLGEKYSSNGNLAILAFIIPTKDSPEKSSLPMILNALSEVKRSGRNNLTLILLDQSNSSKENLYFFGNGNYAGRPLTIVKGINQEILEAHLSHLYDSKLPSKVPSTPTPK